MSLTRLLIEIELLYRSEIRFGLPARRTVAQLVINYLDGLFDTREPPMPTYAPYEWPRHVTR